MPSKRERERELTATKTRSTIDLINFGSGFRNELHASCQRVRSSAEYPPFFGFLITQGAYETIQYGIINLFLSRSNLDARVLTSLSLTDVADGSIHFA
jgi:hypothetical protein